MRILMVIESGSDMNPYVSSLASGLTECGHEVVCSLTLFWDCFEKYDLLYFQWPEAVFDWRKNEIDIDKLSKHFKRIKEIGIKTLITCHNLHPHNNDTKTTELYNTIYAKVDAFHHMGRFSYKFMKEKYPDRHHFIAPHHVSDSLWLNPVCISEAKEKFRIPKSNIVVSSFGAFRNTDEVWLFVNMAKDINDRNLSFLAPRIPKGRFYNGFNVKRTIKYLYKILIFNILGIKYSGFLTNEELREWLCASDIVFIQRKEILNSGNLPLAFASGKVVVGPDLGNVGEILRETGNFVFDQHNRTSVKQAVLNAVDEVKKGNGLGARNYQYAKEYWTTSKVCEQISRELLLICQSC